MVDKSIKKVKREKVLDDAAWADIKMTINNVIDGYNKLQSVHRQLEVYADPAKALSDVGNLRPPDPKQLELLVELRHIRHRRSEKNTFVCEFSCTDG